jgi:CRISPR-associated protein Cas1
MYFIMDTYRIIINQYGALLGKHSERLIIKSSLPVRTEPEGIDRQLPLPFPEANHVPGECSSNLAPAKPIQTKSHRVREKQEIPFFRISELIIASKGVSISADLIEELCQRGIPITFMTPGGRPYANLTSPCLSGTVVTRREQLKSYADERGVLLVKVIIAAKLKNQSHCLKYFAKYLNEQAPERYRLIRQAAHNLLRLIPQVKAANGGCIDHMRGHLLGLEGTAGRIYWEGVSSILDDGIGFAGRQHQGAADPFNAAINYGYGILYARIWGAVLNAGLEPFAGFMHVDRPGKPSLVLDLIEEFRQAVVDRAVIACFNLGQEVSLKGGLLDESSRKCIAERVNERLETPAPYQGQKLKVSSIIQAQARAVASFLRGGRIYKPYVMRW